MSTKVDQVIELEGQIDTSKLINNSTSKDTQQLNLGLVRNNE